MPSLSAIVIARNEERHIANCLGTLTWADEIVVLDSFSVDATVEVAGHFGAKVHQRAFTNFSDQRNAAMLLAQGDWILFVDADERCTPGLAEEVRLRIHGGGADPDLPRGFWIPRRNFILGKWIKHAGWYPDHQLRLMLRGQAIYDEAREVHEFPTVQGKVDYLTQALIHHNYEKLSQLLAKQDFYSTYEARTMHGKGIRPRPQNYVLQPLREFKRRYFEWQGYKDGLHGLFLCTIMAWFNFVTYVKLARVSTNRQRISE
ncbi:MAG: glycosyltransferase family 2 protein [Chloroflexi bacterium]|nr:glycosyltransferase family 2 protein [Chloroflexota bacterium]